MWILRKVLTPLSTIESIEFLLGKLTGTKTNKDFLDMMNK
jgi:transcription termination factor Rho